MDIKIHYAHAVINKSQWSYGGLLRSGAFFESQIKTWMQACSCMTVPHIGSSIIYIQQVFALKEESMGLQFLRYH